MDGYPAYLLGSMDYLNRSNVYDYLNTVFLILALACVGLLIFFNRKERKIMAILLVLSIGTLSFGASVATFEHLTKVNYPLPEPHSDFTNICFVEDLSDFSISSRPVWNESLQIKKFNTFFIWSQRVDLVPSIEKTLDDAVVDSDAIIIINPVGSIGQEEIDTIVSYVEEGGNLLLMDGILNTQSTANNLLPHFGMWINRDSDNYQMISEYNYTIDNSSMENETIIDESNNSENNTSFGNVTTPSLSIIGGEKIFITEDNSTSIATVQYGEGKVVVVVDSFTFCDVVMGGSFTEPDEDLRKIYDTEYYIFEEILFTDN